ncbi:hypothetical protein ABIB25_001654 [Nakamurella sp. UYEF19]|uniref:hypothetical protein n=1 Tax=Nakamurella sp. UYEF19 TaxID=1756392 RepID=UPI0033966A1D
MISREELLTHLAELDRRRADADARAETVLARWESTHGTTTGGITTATGPTTGDITLRSAQYLGQFRSQRAV